MTRFLMTGRTWTVLFLAAMLAAAWHHRPLLAQAPAPANTRAVDKKDDKWEKTIAAFEAEDAQAAPPKDAVLFVGSSSIRLWDLKKSFSELATINRGFGGSQMSDAAQYATRIITPYKPRLIVLYEGDTDLGAKKSPAEVVQDFDRLVQLVRADLPATPLVVIGCKPSPKRWALIESQRELNRLLEERCRELEHATFLDVEKPLLNDDGQPRAELFREDQLHLNDKGYAVWNSLISPLIRLAGEESSNP
jgi:lysophospholipase L1-like esterase